MSLILVKRLQLQHVTFFEDSSDFKARMEALDPHPNIIFLDIHLKPYSGFEMLKILRNMESFRSVPIVALTASVMNEEIQLLRTSGFDSCIAKPVDAAMFPETFQRILQGEHIWRIT